MADFIIQYHSKNRAQLVSHDEDLLNEAQLLFSYQKRVFGSFRASADLSGTGVYSCISPSFTFKIGLVLEIYKQLTNAGYKVKIDNELKKHVQPKTHLNESLIQPHANFTYRDYQEETIRRVARFGRGLIEIPTSGGKSLILYGICSNIKEFSKKTLIVVPRTQLVEQFFKELNLGISATEHLALAVIIETKDCCQRDLARIILKDRANTGKLANLLEQKGLIEIKATIKNNRAVKILTPTKKGVNLNKKIMDIVNPLLKKINDEISEKIMEETKTALKNIREIVQKNVKTKI